MLLTRGTLVTMGEGSPGKPGENEVIPDGALYIEGGRFADLGPSAELEARYPTAERLDAGGRLVMPGLICAHTHFYGAFARGMGLPGEPASNFPEILEKLWWRLDKALWPDDVHTSALVCLVDAIRHGTTTLIDHHASQGRIAGSLEQIAKAVDQAGVRACLCYEVTDRDGEEATRAGIRENAQFIRQTQMRQREGDAGGDGGRLAATFGLHASLTLSEATLKTCVDLAGQLGVGFHLHVAEDKADQRDSLRRSGLRVVERLKEAGVLGPLTLAAHCVQVDRIETEILLDSGAMVVHNPRSNMNNAVGTADVPWMLKIGIPVGLGNDGFSNNMFTEMAAAYLVHKQAAGDPRTLPADQVVQMAWDHNARIARTYFPVLGPRFGHLAVGAPADAILVDYDPPTPLTAGNLPWHILFGMDGTGVDTTIVAGRVLMRHRKLLTLDESAIMAKARELAGKLWQRI
ncbi:MAG TPA: putative aminohydrolase SsnA [Anaerolineae bacterium]|nr:putative aminohydrolase SsnA [Anaerolineae bacterium]